MNDQGKTKEELISELLELRQTHNSLKATIETDMLSHQLTEEELRASEERFQLLFDKAPLGYQSLDINGCFIEVNQQWLNTLGYERDEVMGKWFGDFLTPAFQDGFRQRFPIFKAQGHIHSEFEMVHKNGSILFIAFDGRIGNDSNGNFKQTHCILQDITEKKRAEKNLRESETQYRNLANSSLTLIWTSGTDKLCNYFNEPWLKFTGRTLEQEMGNGWTEGVYPDDFDSCVETYITAFDRQEAFEMEYRLRHVSGEYRWILDMGTPNYNSNNEFIGYIGNCFDITERKENECALKENEEKFRNFFENSVVGKSITSIDGKLSVNSAFCKIVGYSEVELKNQNWKEITHADDIELNINIINSILKGEKQSYRWEKRYIHKDGHIVWTDISTTLQRDEKGNPLYFITAINDITERKKTEKALNESRKMLELVIDSIPQFIIWKDRNSVYLGCNENFARAAGLKSALEIVGKTDYDFSWKKEEADFFVECDRRVMESGIGEYHIIEPQLQANGKQAWLETNKVPILDENGQVVGILGTYEDITERKQAEETLQTSEENLSITLHSIGDGVISTDINGLIVNMNPVAEKLCSWKLTDALGKPLNEVFKIINAETRLTVADPVERVLENGEIVGLANHTILVSKDGAEYQIADSAAPIKNKDGEISGVVLVFSDVTEKYAVELALKLSEERYALVIDASEQGIWDWNMETNEVYFSEQWKKQIGYDDHELKNDFSVWVDHLHPDEREYCQNAVGSYLNHPVEHFILEFRFRHKDGTYRWIRTKAASIKNNNGKVIRLFGVHTDITEHKQAEQLVLENHELIKLFIKHSPINAYIKEVTPISSKVLFASDNFIEMIGIKGSEMIGKTMQELFPAEFAKKITADDWNIVSKGELFKLDEDLNNKNYYTIKFPILLNDKKLLAGYTIDITERKKVEEELRKSQEMMVSSQSVAHICSYSTNLNANELDKSVWICSPEFYNVFGIDETYPHTIAGWAGLIHPDHRDQLVAYHEKVVKNGISFSHEYKIIRINDGAERWVHGTGELEYDKQGNPIRMYGAIQDITERKIIENEINLHKKQFEDLYENAPVGYHEIDTEGRFVRINKTELDMLGYSSKEVLGRHIWEFVNNHDLSKSATKNKLSGFEISALPYEREFIHKNGNVIPILLKDKVILDSTGKITGNRSIIQDITERKQAENALEKIQKLHAETERIGKVGGWEFNMDTYEQIWTQETYNIHEVPYSFDATVENGINFFTPESLPIIQNAVKLAVEQDEPFDLELEIITAKGNTKSVHTVGQVDSEKRKIYGFFQDITEQKKAEQELIIEKKHAEESDRLKSAFLANMSHEIRTPMNGILGFTDLLKDPELSGEQQHQYIRIIEKSGTRMLNIINDIIDISRIEAGLMNLKTTETNINKNIEYLYTFFKPEVEAKGMALKFNTSLTAQEATITTDREKVYAILTNLVKNAIKYSNQGTIELGYECVETRHTVALPRQTFLQFYVKDTGIGIPKDRHEAIFERFIQADIVDKMARQGAGLGLAITKAYVEMLGGKIWVESEEGIGSTFYFTLPYNANTLKPNNDQLSGNSNNAIQVKKLKVLIAEDDEISELLLDKTAEMFSKEILKARTGTEAIEFCRQNTDIDLVLMDIQMPEMNGYEATRQIRQFNEKVIIIAQTAYGLSGDREKAIEAGCNDYIAKPISKEVLSALLRKYFSK